MANGLQRLIPSMFSRRLLALAAAAVGVTAILAAQLAWLTIAEGAQRRERAEKVLESTIYTPTVRGRILDCKDRVLAGEHASYDVAVHYSMITGDWAYDRARRAARREHRYEWNDLSERERDELAVQQQGPFNQQIDELWRELCRLGEIDESQLQQRRATIIERVQQVASHLWVRWRRIRQRESGRPVTLNEVADPIAEQEMHHPVLHHIGAETRVRVEQLIAEADGNSVWSKVSVTDSRRRVYPYEKMTVEVDLSTLPGPLKKEQTITVDVEGVALHALGAMRKIWPQDTIDHPFVGADGNVALDGYRPGDLRGSWGIEKSQEWRLRGTRGLRIRDNITRQTVKTIEPVPGRDVMISLDINLQARIQALMGHDPRVGLMRRQQWHEARELPANMLGRPLNGAAVVMDVATGQIRAAVSVPGITRSGLQDDYERLHKDRVNMPLLNRAIGANYPPGSTVKPLVLSAAVTDRKIAYGGTVECKGMIDPAHPNRMRCWIYKLFYPNTHGPLTGPDAIKHSCNIFFYTMGRRLKAQRLIEWYRRLGLGGVTQCGLDEEAKGILPDLRRAGQPNAPGMSVNEAMLMAIGQGPMAWTPIQACKAYAMVARSGSEVYPTFLGPGAAAVDHPPQTWHFDPQGAELAMRGLQMAANDRGATISALSHELVRGEPIFNVLDDEPELRVMAKSGTADTGVSWVDVNGNNRRDAGEIGRRGDHAWTVCLVQRPSSPRPDFVVAVVVEHAGSGSHAAGPIANQILHAMLAEGYL